MVREGAPLGGMKCPNCGAPATIYDIPGELLAVCSKCATTVDEESTTPDRSGEADETRSGSAEGESGLPEGSSKPCP
jgi:uncharacterized Zn finger protein (UPF0148 family)